MARFLKVSYPPGCFKKTSHLYLRLRTQRRLQRIPVKTLTQTQLQDDYPAAVRFTITATVTCFVLVSFPNCDSPTLQQQPTGGFVKRSIVHEPDTLSATTPTASNCSSVGGFLLGWNRCFRNRHWFSDPTPGTRCHVLVYRFSILGTSNCWEVSVSSPVLNYLRGEVLDGMTIELDHESSYGFIVTE